MPQESTRFFFLFMIFLHDIFEILETGIYLLIYADDILLYELGEDTLRIRAKL